MESRSSPVESQVGCEEKVASETVEIDLPKVSSEEGTHNSCPTIRELVGDLDRSWGNSKDWMLELRDSKQIVIPPSLYRSPNSGSECSIIEGEVVLGNNSLAIEGQIVSWVDKCDGVIDSLFVVTGSKDEWGNLMKGRCLGLEVGYVARVWVQVRDSVIFEKGGCGCGGTR